MSNSVNAAAAIDEELIALERHALDGWIKGDPDPNLAILAEDATYMDPGLAERLDGAAAVKRYFDDYRGTPLFDSCEVLNPRVQHRGEVAVLSYRLLTRKGIETVPYHCTEVFERQANGWRIIHSHFSRAKQG